MNALLSESLRPLLALCLWACAGAAWAAPATSVEPFDEHSWAALQSQLKQPAAVVFTTTDCAHCPAVIQSLATTLRRGHLKAGLWVVVMDMAPGEDDAALLADNHYRAANRLLAFDGQALRLRHGVDPNWRGMTPYVALLRPAQPAVTVVGPPSAQQVDAWVRGFGGR